MPGNNGSKDLLTRKEEGVLFREYVANSFRVNMPSYGREGVVRSFESGRKSRLELYGFPLKGNSEVEDVVNGLKRFGGLGSVCEDAFDGRKNIFIGAKPGVGSFRILGRLRGKQKFFYRNNRALDIRDEIVEKNGGLIYTALDKKGIVGPNREDYSQDLRLSFDRIIDAFDVEIGNRFSTYVMPSFFREISRLIGEDRYSFLPQAFSERGENAYRNTVDPSSVLDPEVFDVDSDMVLKVLRGRDREIMRLRLEGKTLEKVGKRLGLSKEGIRQIQNRAIISVRKELGLNDFAESD